MYVLKAWQALTNMQSFIYLDDTKNFWKALINPLRPELILIEIAACFLNASSASASNQIGTYLYMKQKPVSCTF